MKQTIRLLVLLLLLSLFDYSLKAQNPNWTLPGNNLNVPLQQPQLLPSSPYDPITGQPNLASNYSYQGVAATNLHAGYTDPWGDLMFFTVDENLYDYKGWLVGSFRKFYSEPSPGNYTKRGHSERLILPMGNSCTKYAIIYPGGRDHSGSTVSNELFYSGTGNPPSRQRLYMSIYDTEAVNPFNADAKGTLVGMNQNNQANTLEDISARDYINWGPSVLQPFPNPLEPVYLYGYKLFNGMTLTENVQPAGSQMLLIAASDLIVTSTGDDRCFYYVFVFEGQHIIRYKLTSADLQWDGIVYTDLNLTPGGYVRSEMELIKLSSGNYRLAFPAILPGGTNAQPAIIRLIDLDPQGNYIANSAQTVSLPGVGPDRAEPHGIEFNSTGRYLYFTHKAHPSLPNALDVWDTQTQTLVTSLPTLSNINNFRESYLERYENAIVLASATSLGVFQNPDNPTNPQWQSNAIAVNVSMQELSGNTDATKFRRILPDQIDDGDYTRMLNRSCPCCQEAAAYQSENFEAYYTETWTPAFNPFGNSPDVYIDTELRIKSDSYITIQNMNFYFGPNASVVIERGFTPNENGGVLRLQNTLFTADHRCGDRNFQDDPCDPASSVSENNSGTEGQGGLLSDCDKDYWQGVIVEGFDDLGQPSNLYGSSRQGRFTMEQNSTIEFARQAVHIGNPAAANYGGGIVSVSQSTVKDCVRGFRFDPYTRIQNGVQTTNRSVIDRMDFITTNDFIITQSVSAPGISIDIDLSSGIIIRGCLFHNQNTTANWQPTQRGVGIYASNSRLRVTVATTFIRSRFDNLAKAIDVNNISSSRLIEILDAEFENNVVGAQLNSCLQPAVLRNSFIVPRADNNLGLFLNRSTGYTVEDNKFEGAPGTLVQWNLGLAVWDSGPTFNQIVNNWFEDLTRGISSSLPNANPGDLYSTGLVYKCNYFERLTMVWADIILENGTISVEQGSCNTNDPTLLPRNTFSHSSAQISSHFDFRVNNNVPGNFPSIKYSSPPQGAPSPFFYPLRISEILTGSPTNFVVRNTANCSGIYSSAFACDYSRIPAAGGEGLFEFSEMSGSEEINNLYEQATFLENEVVDAAQEIDGGQTLALINLLFTEGNNETVLAQISSIPEGEMSSLLLEAIQQSSYADLIAESVSSMATFEMSGGSMDVSDAELAWKQSRRNRDIFWQSFAQLTSADTIGAYTPELFLGIANIHQPKVVQSYVASLATNYGYAVPDWVDPKSRRDVVYDPTGILAQYAAAETLPAVMLSGDLAEFSEWSGNIAALHSLYAAQRTMYFPVFEIPEDFATDQGSKSNQNQSVIEESLSFQLYPNPFSDELTLKVAKTDILFEELRIEIFDLLGRRVKSERFGAGNIFTIDGLQLPKGMLTYTIFLDGAPVQNGKVVRVQ